MRTSLAVPMLLSIALVAAPSLVRGQLPVDAATAEIRRTVFAPSLHVDLAASRQTWSGTFVRDLVQGSGLPFGLTNRVRIKFRVWRADGSPTAMGQRDDIVPRDSSDTVTFVIGRGALSRGLEEGVKGMQRGGVRQLVIPSIAAWGTVGRGDVLPNTVLVAEVTLIGSADERAPEFMKR